MPAYLNGIENNAIAALAARAPSGVVNAIQKASARTGVDFAYLLEKASVESGFDADAKAGTSSARGLYQFIESTWLQMVRDHGADYGMSNLAAQIDDKGHVADPAVRKQILNLRNDPEKSAMLAAEFASDNKQYLERTWGGDVGSTELYLAHFLGAGSAAGFLKARDEEPLTAAADLFPKAASANRAVFYDSRTGQPRTLAEVYDFFDKRFSGTDARTAATPPLPPRKAVLPQKTGENMAGLERQDLQGRDLQDYIAHPAALRAPERSFASGGASPSGMASSGGSSDLLSMLSGNRLYVPVNMYLLSKIQDERDEHP